ncbi:hypothetical protein MRX96_049009 [Rhipicephalus microplus]
MGSACYRASAHYVVGALQSKLTDLPQAIKAAESGSSAEHGPEQARSTDSSPDAMPQGRQHNREVTTINASHRSMHYPDSSATTELSSDLV